MLLAAILAANAFDTVQVAKNVYALVGELGQRSPVNLGHNMTSGFIVTAEGVVVIDTGGSLANAQAIHAAIRQVTTKSVIYAVNTGGQDHRWLGNEYFRRQGARIVTAEAAARYMRERGLAQAEAARSLLKDKFDGTRLAYPATGVSPTSTRPCATATTTSCFCVERWRGASPRARSTPWRRARISISPASLTCKTMTISLFAAETRWR